MRIGIIGAGMIGATLAKLWSDAGHEVRLASRHPDALQALVKTLGPRASAGTPADAAAFGKVVLDTGNAYEQRDGAAAIEATRHPRGSAGWAADMFPGARWVKAFNSVY